MSDPSAPVQKAMRAALVPVQNGAIPFAVYDRVPEAHEFPYVTLESFQVLRNAEGNTCDEDLCEVTATVHVWSRAAAARVEIELIGDIIVPALAVRLDMAQWRCHAGNNEDANYFWDADGVTGHGVLTFRYLVQPL